jgi:hypothetical protein
MPMAIPLLVAAFEVYGGVVAVGAAVTVGAEVLGGLAIAGGVLSAAGTLTGNKTLSTLGGVVGLVGGVAGLAVNASNAADLAQAASSSQSDVAMLKSAQPITVTGDPISTSIDTSISSAAGNGFTPTPGGGPGDASSAISPPDPLANPSASLSSAPTTADPTSTLAGQTSPTPGGLISGNTAATGPLATPAAPGGPIQPLVPGAGSTPDLSLGQGPTASLPTSTTGNLSGTPLNGGGTDVNGMPNGSNPATNGINQPGQASTGSDSHLYGGATTQAPGTAVGTEPQLGGINTTVGSGAGGGVSVADSLKAAAQWATANPEVTKAGAGLIQQGMAGYSAQDAMKTKMQMEQDFAQKQRDRYSASVKGLKAPVYKPPTPATGG